MRCMRLLAATCALCTAALVSGLNSVHLYTEFVEQVAKWTQQLNNQDTFTFDAKYIKMNWIYVSGIFASELATALDASSHLRVLDLSNAQLGTSAIVRIVDSLDEHRNLKLVQLSGNNMRCEGASAVARLLLTHPNLRGVWLGNNDIGDRGLVSLSQALLDGAPITVLGLSGNRFVGEGVLALAAAIKKGVPLASLSIQRSHITHDGYRALAVAVGESKTLNTLFIDEVRPSIFNAFVQACHVRLLALRLGWRRQTTGDRPAPACAQVQFGTNTSQTRQYNQIVKQAEASPPEFSRQAPGPWLTSLQRMLQLPELSDVYHKMAYLCVQLKQPDWALAWFYLARDTTGLQYAAQRYQEVNRIRERDAHEKLSKGCNGSCFDRALSMLELLKRNQ